MSRMTGAQMVLEGLQREGVEVIFGYPGGVVLPLYDTLPQYPGIRHILVRHEQGAAHMADGYARASGKMGVCLGTSGPGATNLVTGICTAWMDSVPVFALTGNVSRTLLGKDGFQEADITGITHSITKHNYLVMRAEEIPLTIREAAHICRTGRPGPVLVDIPKDVFQETAEFDWPEKIHLRGYRPTYEGHAGMIRRAAELIDQARRPIIIAGHGVIWSDAQAELVALAGYLRRVPPAAVHRYEGRMVNIHPALLPAFGGPGMYGLHVHRAVLATGCRVSGATAHLVDEEYDHGPILAQWPVPVLPEDTPEHLAARVLRVEHMLYPAVVEALARGRRLEGPRGAEAFALVGSGAPDPDEVRRALGLEPLPAGAARSP